MKAQPVPPPLPKVTLAAPAVHALSRGHPWVYQQQLKTWQGTPAKGDLVEVQDGQGRRLGYAYANLETPISLRMLYSAAAGVRGGGQPNERDELARKLRRAYSRRQAHAFQSNAMRLVWSEADGLPGLVCDQYDRVLVIQFLTAGMEARRDLILNWFSEWIKPSGLYERSEGQGRTREGLPPRTGWIGFAGTEPPAPLQTITEGPLRFKVDIASGQKTGFYLDQRAARRLLAGQSLSGNILDCFAYTGGFSVAAAYAGADLIEAVDSSPTALEQCAVNAELNGFRERIVPQRADVFDFLQAAAGSARRYSGVILDPPSFSRARAQAGAAWHGYHELHRRAGQVLAPGGFLLSCCCSHSISRLEFVRAAQSGVRAAGRRLRILSRFGPDADHPEPPQVPQSRYLTCLWAQVV